MIHGVYLTTVLERCQYLSSKSNNFRCKIIRISLTRKKGLLYETFLRRDHFNSMYLSNLIWGLLSLYVFKNHLHEFHIKKGSIPCRTQRMNTKKVFVMRLKAHDYSHAGCKKGFNGRLQVYYFRWFCKFAKQFSMLT